MFGTDEIGGLLTQEAYVLAGADVLLPDGRLDALNVRVVDGKIDQVGSDAGECGPVIDLKGLILAPGFVDIHVNGGGGCSFESTDAEAFETVIVTGYRFGTTSVVGAINTSTCRDRIRQLESLAAFKKSERGVALLGVHLEGPYYSPEQRGAHHPEWIRDPDPNEYGEWIDRFSDLIRVVTFAPELPGGMELTRALSRAGIVPAIGHSIATDETVDQAIEAGARLVTHIYNAQSSFTRHDDGKYLGVAEMGLLRDALTVEIIPDNRHLTPRMQELVVKTKPNDKICITTDAMEATGQGPGTYNVMGGVVWVDEEVAYREDRKRHAGSILTMDKGVRNVVKAGAPVANALMMATEVPARTIGAEQKGLIAEGCDADFVMLNQDLKVVATIVAGRVVHAIDGSPATIHAS